MTWNKCLITFKNWRQTSKWIWLKYNESENYKDSKLKPNDEETIKKPTVSSSYHLVKCELCDEGFNKMSDLEKHLKSIHESHQNYEWEKCAKKFLTNWRLDKHARMHSGCKHNRKLYFFITLHTCITLGSSYLVMKYFSSKLQQNHLSIIYWKYNISFH